MSYIPMSAKDAAAAEAGKTFKAQKDKRSWFMPSLYAVMFAGLLGIGLFLVPAAKGEEMSNELLKHMGISFALTVCGAMILSWIMWRICRRNDTAANVTFSVIIILVGFWVLGLNDTQRANAESKFHKMTDGKFVVAASKAHQLFD